MWRGKLVGLRGFGKHDTERQGIYWAPERLSCLKEILRHRFRHFDPEKLHLS
jgi:hypothetical protein